MFLRLFIIAFTSAVMLSSYSAAFGQDTEPNSPGSPQRETAPRDTPRSPYEALARHRSSQAKKQHEEMLKRGDEALELVDRLQSSLDKNEAFTTRDAKDLESIEKLVNRIRKDLGAGSLDREDDEQTQKARSAGPREAFGYLKRSVYTLVSELNKTSRFSISAAAIQTSDGIIKIARFLRLKR
jgi:hypothetical protein